MSCSHLVQQQDGPVYVCRMCGADVTNVPTGPVEDWPSEGQAMLDAIAATKMEARMNEGTE